MSTNLRLHFANYDEENKVFNVLTEFRDIAEEFTESQSYAFYGFLGCNHRNYSKVPEIAGIERIKLPAKVMVGTRQIPNDWIQDEFWYSLPTEQLLSVDWDTTFEDRRAGGWQSLEEGEGTIKTYKEAFRWFYDHLGLVRRTGAEYLVYTFID